MSDVQIWSEVAVDVQTTLAAPKNITGISKANPAVVTLAGHGYGNGKILLLRVKGMGQLDWLVVRVANTAEDNFALEGVDLTDAEEIFVSGSAQEVTFGASAETFTDVTPSGGEAEKVAVRTIHRRKDYNLPGNVGTLTYGFGSLWDVADPALIELSKASRKREVRAIRFRFLDGATVLFAGMPSTTLAPGGSAGAAVTTPVSIDVRGELQAYPGEA